jgi:hypothetical protein
MEMERKKYNYSVLKNEVVEFTSVVHVKEHQDREVGILRKLLVVQ